MMTEGVRRQRLKEDGLDLLRTETARELRKYARRIKAEALRLYNEAYAQVEEGERFNPELAAREALREASGGLFLGTPEDRYAISD